STRAEGVSLSGAVRAAVLVTFGRLRSGSRGGCRRATVIELTQLRFEKTTQASTILTLDGAQLLDLLVQPVLLGVHVVHGLGVLALGLAFHRRGLVTGLPFQGLGTRTCVVEHRLGPRTGLVHHRV